MNGHAPAPALMLAALACVAAFSTDQPLVLAAILLGAIALHRTAPAGGGRWLLLGAAISAAGLVVLTPLVSAQGDLVVLRGPRIPVLDTEITAEELLAGAVSGMRLAGVTVLIAAVLAHIDADRLQALVARVAPRSALLVALSARLLPTLERDARALSELARLRGVALADGPRRVRAAHAARLTAPLVGSSLERGMDVAEAMAARGYGSGPATRPARAPRTRAEWLVWACTPLALGAAIAITVRWVGAYRLYPTAANPLSMGAALAAAALLCALMGAAWAMRGRA